MASLGLDLNLSSLTSGIKNVSANFDLEALTKSLDPTACGTPLNLDAVTGFMDDIKANLELPSVDLKAALPDLDGLKDDLMGALGDLKPELPDLGLSFKDEIARLQSLAGPEFAALKSELESKWKDAVPDLNNILGSVPDLNSLVSGALPAVDMCSAIPEINAKFETIDGVAVATEITKQAQNALTPDKTAAAVEEFSKTIVDKSSEEVVSGYPWNDVTRKWNRVYFGISGDRNDHFNEITAWIKKENKAVAALDSYKSYDVKKKEYGMVREELVEAGLLDDNEMAMIPRLRELVRIRKGYNCRLVKFNQKMKGYLLYLVGETTEEQWNSIWNHRPAGNQGDLEPEDYTKLEEFFEEFDENKDLAIAYFKTKGSF